MQLSLRYAWCPDRSVGSVAVTGGGMTLDDTEELKRLSELSRWLRDVRRGNGNGSGRPVSVDNRLEYENPYYSPRDVRGEWRSTTQ
jgi:phage portal protein BeeE